MKVIPYHPEELKNIKTPKEVISSNNQQQEFCLIFGGGGWRSLFFLGLLYFIENFIGKDQLKKRWKFAGESGGSLFAAYMALGLDTVELIEVIRKVVNGAYNSYFHGIFESESFGNAFLDILFTGLPDQVVKENGDRLIISTNLIDFCSGFTCKGTLKPHLLKNFETINDIKLAINCSAYLPGPHPILKTPKVKGKFCCDAGLTTAGSVPSFDNCIIIYSLCCGAPYPGVPSQFNYPSIEPKKYLDCGLLSLVTAPSPQEFDEMIFNGYECTSAFFMKYGSSLFQLKLNIPNKISMKLNKNMFVLWSNNNMNTKKMDGNNIINNKNKRRARKLGKRKNLKRYKSKRRRGGENKK